MFLIDFERPDAGCIVNGGIFEATDFLAALVNKAEEFDIYLDVMARHLSVVAFCVDLANARSAVPRDNQGENRATIRVRTSQAS